MRGGQIKPSKLFLAFLRLGLTAFGGPAMVAYIRDLAVTKNKWISEESFQHEVALCQSIPGATAMQAAAYVGFRAGGPFGAVAAYLGFGTPAFLLMMMLTALYSRTHEMATVVSAFSGLQVIVVALVANATLSFGRSSIRVWQDVLLVLSAAAFLVSGGSPIWAILVSAFLAIFLYRGMDLNPKDHATVVHEKLRQNLRAPICLILLAVVGLFFLFILTENSLISPP